MIYLQTVFDNQQYPLSSSVYKDGKIVKYTMYLPGNQRIEVVLKVIELFKNNFIEPYCLNDFKSHLIAFSLPNRVDYDVYDINYSEDFNQFIKTTPQPWHRLRANASVVYRYLENKGIIIGLNPTKPIYDLYTLTGRSRIVGADIRGMNDEYVVKSIDTEQNYYICFDWVAADIRIASFMSGDVELEKSFTVSDPYAYLAELTNTSRNETKIMFLKSFYKTEFDNPIFGLFPTFRSFAADRLDRIIANEVVHTILNRPIIGNNEKQLLSVFNGQFQGSVAHCMQAILIQIFKEFPDNILTEMYDSVIMCCNKDQIASIINRVSEIMLDPLNGIISPSPRMPFRISIGKKWRKWKLLKVIR